MLENFGKLWNPKTKVEDLVDIYYKAFRKHPEINLLKAAESCMNELEFWPKPIDLISRLPKGGSAIDESSFRIREQVRCSKCGYIGMCIEEPSDCGEWRCRQCYTGMSVSEIKQRLKGLREKMDNGRSKEINPEKPIYENS